MDGDSRSDDSFLRAVASAPSVAPADLVGKVLGRYRINSVLGRGGMGIVYLADDLSLDRAVALKVLPSTDLGDVEKRHRFVREAKLAAQVRDPHVAAVYDAGEIGEHVFLAMELVVGPTLRAEIARGPLPIIDVERFALQIARGLAAVHRAGVIHRDVKPDNVLVSDGVAKLVDFGIAKRAPIAQAGPDRELETATHEGRLLGTPMYMSPEQAKGEPLDARADVFSFGVLLYEMATGTRPFAGKTALDVLIAIDRDAPESAQRLRRDLPARIARVIDGCLAKERAARFASADAIVEAIETAPRPARSTARWLVALGAVSVGLVALAVWHFESPPPARRAAAATSSMVTGEEAPPAPAACVAPGASANVAVSVRPPPRSAATASARAVLDRHDPGPLDEPK